MLELAEIKTMDRTELLSTENIKELFCLETSVQQARYFVEFCNRATELKCKSTFEDLYKLLQKDYAPIPLRAKKITNISDFVDIMRDDEYFAEFKFNEFSKLPETRDPETGKMRVWTDFDDSAAKCYIEQEYNLRGGQKYIDALNILQTERRYNPVKNAIEETKWDGVDRIETLLIKWLKCEDSPYTRELSRLIFAGGIHRAYEPGYKTDNVVILVGKQGCGKSTFIRWLALKEELYSEINSIEGKDAKEALLGIWIAELGELLAVTKAKECEAVKAFLSAKYDRFRPSYARRAASYPRQCVFIGSTNKHQFLTDKTGNRRMYPVKVRSNIRELIRRKDEVQSDIRQCWAEALEKIDTDFMSCAENESLLGDIEQQQKNYMEEDYREGMIMAFLDGKEKTCIAEIWERGLSMSRERLGRKESNDIALIMQGIPLWERCGSKRFGDYGVQQAWVKQKQEITWDDVGKESKT